jgi:hypothetical protein
VTLVRDKFPFLNDVTLMMQYSLIMDAARVAQWLKAMSAA